MLRSSINCINSVPKHMKVEKGGKGVKSYRKIPLEFSRDFGCTYTRLDKLKACSKLCKSIIYYKKQILKNSHFLLFKQGKIGLINHHKSDEKSHIVYFLKVKRC